MTRGLGREVQQFRSCGRFRGRWPRRNTVFHTPLLLMRKVRLRGDASLSQVCTAGRAQLAGPRSPAIRNCSGRPAVCLEGLPKAPGSGLFSMASGQGYAGSHNCPHASPRSGLLGVPALRSPAPHPWPQCQPCSWSSGLLSASACFSVICVYTAENVLE